MLDIQRDLSRVRTRRLLLKGRHRMSGRDGHQLQRRGRSAGERRQLLRPPLVTRFSAFAWFLPGFFYITVRRTVVFRSSKTYILIHSSYYDVRPMKNFLLILKSHDRWIPCVNNRHNTVRFFAMYGRVPVAYSTWYEQMHLSHT